MQSTKGSLVLGLAILVLTLVPSQSGWASGAKSDKGNWENLRRVETGSTVRVVLKNARTFQGTMENVTESGISIRDHDGTRAFPKDQILRVSAKRKSHRKRNLLIGLGAGAVTGVIVGVASPELGQGTCEQGSCVDAGTVSLVSFGGAIAGTIVGAAIPTGGWQEFYRQP